MTRESGIKKKKVLLVALNMPSEYCLALYYLKLFAYKNEVIRNNLDISIHECNVTKNFWRVLYRLIKKKPDLYAFSCNIWNIKKTLRLARFIKFLTRKRIVLGGQEVTNSSFSFLAVYSFIDIIVDGEGEETFRDVLLDFIQTGFNNLKDIDGILYRHDHKEIKNKPRIPIEPLDLIPSPYLSLEIRPTNSNHYGMMIEFARGCAHRCSFCFEGKKYKKSRLFSLERIEKEIIMGEMTGVRKFHFLDPIIANGDEGKLKTLSEIIHKHFSEGEEYFIPIEVYAEFIDERNSEFLKVFSAFDVGLQTINEQVQKNIHRSFHLEKFIHGYTILKKLNKEIVVYILIGLPGDTFFSLMKSIKFVTRLKPTFFYTNHLLLLNGTYMRDEMEAYNIRYEPDPPYEIVSNNTLAEREMIITRRIAEMNMKMYNLSLSLYKKACK